MTTQHQVVNFTVEKRERLREAYLDAAKEKRDTFEFDGHTYVTAFAKYVLEYLDTHLGGPTP